MDKIKTSLIGLGRISIEDHLPAIQECTDVELDSICDTDGEKVDRHAHNLNIKGFTCIEKMLEQSRPDAAIVAVPHSEYVPILRQLAKAKVHILKEKPLATSMQEAVEIHEIVQDAGIRMLVTLQRRFNPIFRAYEQFRNRIGRVFHFDARYTLNIANLEEGWRSSKEQAGGGCLIDMGYHSIDLLMWYFGLPKEIQAIMSQGNREGQDYDVEDTCSLMMDYGDGTKRGERMHGSLFVSRVATQKEEKLTIHGTNGTVEVERMGIRHMNALGNAQEELRRTGEWPSAFIEQLATFAAWIRGNIDEIKPRYQDHFNHVALIEAAYLSDEERRPVSPSELLQQHHVEKS